MLKRASVVASLVAFVAACGAHESDYVPQIAVQPGAAARAMALTAHVHERTAPAAKPKDAPPAKATSTPRGEVVLSNEAIAVVIDREGRIDDAGDARARHDAIGAIGLRDVAVDAIGMGTSADGAAWADVRGHATSDANVKVATRITLRAGDRALSLESWATNEGDRAATFAFDDAIDWGDAEPVASSAFAGAVGRFASFALTTSEGTRPERSEVTLKPRERAKSERVFVVGERSDLASVVAELTRASGGALGTIAIALVDASGRAVDVAAPKIVLANAQGEPVMTMRAARGDVPPGEYVLSFASGGGRRGKPGETARVVVRDGEVASATLSAGDPGFLALACVEARGEPWHAYQRAPCRASVEGIDGTPSPDAAQRSIASADGAIGAAIPPGKYRVIAARGIEDAPATWEATVAPNVTTRGPLEGAIAMKRVVDTRGYLAADLSPRGALVDERIVAEVADGVEVARGDANERIRAMRVQDRIGSIAPFDADVVAIDDAAGARALIDRVKDGKPATPIGGRGVRTYVGVWDDGPMGTWGPTRQEDFVAGVRDRRDVVVTSGPFVRVSANDAPIGGVAKARGSSVTVRVHVESAKKDELHLRVLRASGAAAFEGAIVSDATVTLDAKSDDAFVVVIEGAHGAFAVTAPIWIDADGDGASLGRKEIAK